MAAAIASLRGGAISIPPGGLRDTLLLAKRLAPQHAPLVWSDDAVLGRATAVDAYLKGNTAMQSCRASY